jgi:Asp-tRNA(Asn)/Glu-tRNA(Gln) amidotransferase A subunit family amidase
MNDLIATRERLSRGGSTALSDELARAVAIATSPACDHAFLTVHRDAAAQAARRKDIQTLPLAGLAVSVKDLFDVAGEVTPAGSAVLADAAPAQADSAAVARLRAAGATLIGRTNMSEFAFSGVGVNPHHGTPANPADPATPRVPGGSSSGAAVSVAAGAAFIGLGSDTGGSIRIPAALCGIVGFKNTARLTPLDGALPLSTTLDTVCAMTLSVRDAVLVHEILAGRRVSLARKPLAQLRFAVARTTMLDGLEPAVAKAFDATLGTLRNAGARIDEIALDAIHDLGTIQATGGFAAAESYAWHRQLLAERGAGYDPRVRTRIERGAGIKAWEYLDLARARAAWIARVESDLRDYDAVLSPTVPIVAPPIAQVAPGTERDEAFFRVNGQLLRNTSVVNMLDGCAISIPCHAAGDLPVGLMLWHGALHDDALLDAALAAEAALAASRGA